MRDRSRVLGLLFSIGIHGLMISLLIPSSPKVALEKPFTVAVVWENSSSPCHSRPRGGGGYGNPGKSSAEKVKMSGKHATAHIKKVSYIPNITLDPRDPRLREDEDDKKGDENKENAMSIHDKGLQLSKLGCSKNLQKQAYHPLPKYPWICRKRHQEGAVSLDVKTNGEGQVIDAALLKSSGYDRLDEAALEAIRSWTFAEGNLQKTISIAFRLKG